MHSFRWLRPLACVGVLAAVAATGASSSLPAATELPAALQHRHDPIKDKVHRDGHAVFNSSNWSGYSVIGPDGSVTGAHGSWVVPSVTCSAGPSQYSSFWVGIDGFNSPSVEQTGTDSDCSSGRPQYYAWFEFYPNPSFLINTSAIGTIKPGVTITADVTFGGGVYTVTLTNGANSFTTSSAVSSAKGSSAEWIAEAPSSSGGVLPIANFGTVGFLSNSATIGGAAGTLRSFFPANCPNGFNGSCNSSISDGVQQVDLVQKSGATATPSDVASNSSFSVTVQIPAGKKHGK